MATSFSSNGSEVIHRTINTKTPTTYARDIDSVAEEYELPRCKNWIEQGNFKQVALQFPDELLTDSVTIIHYLQQQTTANYFILGDTSYGSCCVDEVAAQHYCADSLIHFGHTCLSPTKRLPVLYIFGCQEINIEKCVESFTKLQGDKSADILLLFDVCYHHAIGKVESCLTLFYTNLIASQLCLPVCSEKAASTDSEIRSSETSVCKQNISLAPECDMNYQCFKRFGRHLHIKKDKVITDYDIFYIGSKGITLTNFMMTYNKNRFFTYDPQTQEARQETVTVNKQLMKRYYMIERAKDAGIVGILVGTLGVADYLKIINRLETLISQAGKKSYTFVVGKLNVPKLANFMEVDVYVLVSCPENTLIDSSEFYKPVITPYELEIACNQAREWTGDYITDFRELLPGGVDHVAIPDVNVREADVSLITGGVRQLGIPDPEEYVHPTGDKQVMQHGTNLTLVPSAGEALSHRSWRGLEQNLGQTPVVKAEQGRKGIAMGYSDEPYQESNS